MSRFVCLKWIRLFPIVMAIVLSGGCIAVQELPAPGRVYKYEEEPESGRHYHMYVPSYYDDQPERTFPLLVVCHGTNPYDTATFQLDAWKGLAEQKGFVVVTPKLQGTKGDFTPAPAEQVRRQLADERAILSIVRDVQASRRIDPDRVFLTGWSAGGYAVLFTGLRNPDVFRALSVRQGNFNPEFVELCVPFLDRYQPVQVVYGSIDPLKDHSLEMIDWLRRHDMQPTIRERSGTHRRDPQPVYEFFVQVVRQRPWVVVRVQENPTDPMEITFSLKTSFEPVKYLWDFGDGQRSPQARPTHRYDKADVYTITVGAWRTENRRAVRRVQLRVPRSPLVAADEESEEEPVETGEPVTEPLFE